MSTMENKLSFTFTGSSGEYFKIWIVNTLLTILTLGIYSAWATVRTKRYFYGNTWLDGANFEYHATPLQILPGRILVLLMLGIYLLSAQFFPAGMYIILIIGVVVLPWAMWRSLQFNAGVSSYRNIRFKFDGDLGGAYWLLLLLPALAVLGVTVLNVMLTGSMPDWNSDSAFLVTPEITQLNALQEMLVRLLLLTSSAYLSTTLFFPYWQTLYNRYRLDQHRYGQATFQSFLAAGDVYVIYLKVLVISVLVGIIALLIFMLGTMIIGGLFAMNNAMPPNNLDIFWLIGFTSITLYTLLMITGSYLQAYARVRLRNYVYSNVILKTSNSANTNTKAYFHSNMTITDVWGLYIGNALLLLITLGLAYPAIKIRLARYAAQTTALSIRGNIDAFIGAEHNNQSALGDEIATALEADTDVSVEFGI
ncbi:MAG: DUF898 domain-containing protein [Candidatus Thiothrix sulfatifontis]|nr:MAG: DUF898 domain-containing protein [Candidatus Thiothrix sulfatifontis]